MSLLENKKIQILKSYISENKMNDYKILDGNSRIYGEEAVKLYESTKETDDMKSVYYFLMPKEYQIKYIEDIRKFNMFFKGYSNYIDSNDIQYQVLERMSIIGDLDINLLSRIFLVLLDEHVKGRILTNVVKFSKPSLSSFSILIPSIKEEYQEEIFRCMINDYKSFINIHAVDIEYFYCITRIKNNDLKKEIIKECILKVIPEIDDEYFIEIGVRKWLDRVFEDLNEEDCKEIIDCLKKIEKIDNSIVVSLLPINDILSSYKDYEGVNLGKVICWLADDYEKSSTKEFQDIIKEYIVNQDVDLLEKCRVIYTVTKDLQRCECVELLLQTHNVEDCKEIVIVLFNDFSDPVELNKYPNIKKTLMEFCKENYNIEWSNNLEKLCSKFCFSNIDFDSENIISLINSYEESYDEILSLFDKENIVLNDNVVNTVVNSFLQRQFRIEREEDYNIYSKFESLLIEKNNYTVSEVRKSLDKIQNEIDINKIDGAGTLNIDALFNGDKESMNVLHNITNAYITRCRELFVLRNKDLAYNSLNIQKYYTKSYIKKAFLIDNSPSYIASQIYFSGYNGWNDEENDFIYDDLNIVNSVEQIQLFKKGGIKNPSLDFMKKVKLLDGILDKLYYEKKLFLEEEREDAKYEYQFEEMDSKSILSILSGINIDAYCKKIKDKGYSKPLKNLLSKYKIVGWQEIFNVLGTSCNVTVDDSTIYTLINNFDKIYNKFSQLEEKNKTLTALLDITNVYGCPSSKYETLINKENLEYICLDPNPNKSTATKNTRLSLVPSYVKKMYQRDSITVPSGKKTISLSSNKSIKFSIGDIYDPIALTYGERTGACLRIKGAFSDLFSYCLEDKNGFHIRFNDPSTGEFISRVSGIRNGNTVFLNELRYSVSDYYSSEELVESLQKIAQFLVESTKDSSSPIENVIVSNDYAMSEQPQYHLNLENKKDAFKNLNFNIGFEGNILYTSSEDHKTLVPYKFGDEYTCEYKPYNSFVGLGGPKEANEMINRVYMIDELLKDKYLGDLEIIENVDAQKCIYGYGWVVYIDSSGKLHEKIIEKFKKDKELRTLIEESKKKYFGGQNNEKDWKDNRI